MSFEQEVTTILEGTVLKACDSGASNIALAKVEVSKLLEVSNSSMLALCQDVEQASTSTSSTKSPGF